jgi:hypothetical protein
LINITSETSPHGQTARGQIGRCLTRHLFQTHTAANFHAVERIGKTAGTARLLADGIHQPRQGRRATCQQNMIDAVVGSTREEELQRTRHFLVRLCTKGLSTPAA